MVVIISTALPSSSEQYRSMPMPGTHTSRIFREAGCEEGHIRESSWGNLEKAEVAEGSLGMGGGPVEMGK